MAGAKSQEPGQRTHPDPRGSTARAESLTKALSTFPRSLGLRNWQLPKPRGPGALENHRAEDWSHTGLWQREQWLSTLPQGPVWTTRTSQLGRELVLTQQREASLLKGHDLYLCLEEGVKPAKSTIK